MNKVNELKEMFEMQERFQNRTGNMPTINHGLNIEYVKDMSLAAISEVMEALRETPWKPWKKKQEYNQENFQKEIIDLWHFVINLSIASGMDYKELYKKFVDKNKINIERHKKGY
jgi:dimeric dUTPase (all-alpha-NTP-PPase superfamily)